MLRLGFAHAAQGPPHPVLRRRDASRRERSTLRTRHAGVAMAIVDYIRAGETKLTVSEDYP